MGLEPFVLQVVGEETSRLYAHRLIQSPDPTELEVDQLLETINRFEIESLNTSRLPSFCLSWYVQPSRTYDRKD